MCYLCPHWCKFNDKKTGMIDEGKNLLEYGQVIYPAHIQEQLLIFNGGKPIFTWI
ncbi:MAG: hypothetical protein QG641_2240 [Candidatus Poribacteria bacterium]|nr:hypothetical protein [Candidatus Poribacteria bacterium]